MAEKLRVAMFGQKRLTREGGVEIVVKELCTRMVQDGYQVTYYNRSGHHVSGVEYDENAEYDGICQKFVPTIEGKGSGDIIRGYHNRDKGTVEKKRLHDLMLYFLTRRMNKYSFWMVGKLPEKKSRPRGRGGSQRIGE